MSVQFYWIPGPLANYGTTENGFKGEVRVVSVADFQLVTHANEVQAQEIHSLRADIVDLIAEVARLQRLIQMASDTGDLYERKLDAHETAIGSLRSRLAEAERNEGTLLGMIHHQRDVLRECLPYINESMAGRRPGRSADDIRAAVKALTSDSASVRQSWHSPRCGIHDGDPCDCGGGHSLTSDQPGEAGK